MRRNLLVRLREWKDSANRKPLVLDGARQVGKTWLMREFGRQCFDDVAEFNFDQNEDVREIFRVSKDVPRIIEKLGLVRGKAIGKNTLIILDEIQESPDALNSLKYFRETAPEYAVVSAGSLLGVYLAKGHSHPVGKVNIINVYPLSFSEFLKADEPKLFDFYAQVGKDDVIESVFHSRLLEAYHKYLIIGGLPECVQTWLDTKDPSAVLERQRELSIVYERDFSKHSGKVNPARILTTFRNIPAQLAKENKKFVYKHIQSGARARNYEEAVEWLVTSGLVNRVYLAKKNESPLRAFEELSAFKLYLLDVGLLKAMAEIANAQIILGKDFQFMGALAENFVFQQLRVALSFEPKYFVFDRYEIDFLVQDGVGDIIPIEVKSGNALSSPSLNAYNQRFSPKCRVRFSMQNYKRDGNLINIPIYFAERVMDFI